MAKTTITTSVQKVRISCDKCGKTLTEDRIVRFSLTAHGTGHWFLKDHVIFDSTLKGDYCEECLESIQKAILHAMGTVLPDRYENETTDEKIWNYIKEHHLDS